MPKALDDIRVLDISSSVAGAWCTRQLADFGADVVIVEPRAGHPVRNLAPFTDEGRSIPALYVQANKRSVALDIDTPRGKRIFLDLVRRADVVVESSQPGWLQQVGLGFEVLARRRPGVVLCSITPHGQDGPYAGLPGNDLTDYARSGWASINGLAGREPLSGSAFQASYQAGLAAYGAILSALVYRDGHPDEGQHIDVAEFEVLTSTFSPALLRGPYQGEALGRKATMDITTGPVPVADGHFALTISRAHFWRDAMNLLGLHDLAEDQRYEAGWYRQQHKDEYVDRVQEKMAVWKKMELFDELAVRRVVAGPLLTMAELSENEHLRARGFWTKAANDPGGPTYPGAPVKMSATPWALERRAPRHGEHTTQVLRDIAGITDDHLQSLIESGVIGPSEYRQEVRA
jgi:crotonobetainyl-CoA:carnitine CoA-transferase CaiB-like acyl-CoA transferase